MHSKTLYLLLAFAVTIAAVTAYWDDDDEDDELFDLEDFMEKRGRKSGRKGKGKGKKPKWQPCPNNDRCRCILRKDGSVKTQGPCSQINPMEIGI